MYRDKDWSMDRNKNRKRFMVMDTAGALEKWSQPKIVE